ncbi:TIGR02221 family CRISPR-associated protein [Chloroflexus sp.]|uniref:TIGR02221 family CRISPR-associated protein n=1 Tax=Chloroflexus sp. TaxID=1904827 RepID=UPI0026232A57|nr:TIGR02221 family CRISPR-associated protein [uncultured Chloroflexus sp.]
MEKKAISFLGYTRPGQSYRETTYVYQNRECTTAFMAEATARFFQSEIKELLVVVTEEAYKQNFADLERAVAEVVPIRPIRIPSGRNEGELWDIFAAIANAIEPGDRIIFDITNGFRSIPVLALLVASFVRVVRNATLERMIYGAYDATANNRTPIFDLTPLVTLLDWTSATDAFLRYGRADVLVKLAGNQGLAPTLRQLTDALQTSRPAEVMKTAVELETAINAGPKTVQQQPFTLLLERIHQEYGVFGLSDPHQPARAKEVLRKQLAMIKWYIEKGLYVQAITSSREWLVSLVVFYDNGDLFDKTARNEAEEKLNSRVPASNQQPEYEQIRDLWNEVREVRNSLAHAGMSRNAPKSGTVIKKVRETCSKLEHLLG